MCEHILRTFLSTVCFTDDFSVNTFYRTTNGIEPYLINKLSNNVKIIDWKHSENP